MSSPVSRAIIQYNNPKSSTAIVPYTPSKTGMQFVQSEVMRGIFPAICLIGLKIQCNKPKSSTAIVPYTTPKTGRQFVRSEVIRGLINETIRPTDIRMSADMLKLLELLKQTSHDIRSKAVNMANIADKAAKVIAKGLESWKSFPDHLRIHNFSRKLYLYAEMLKALANLHRISQIAFLFLLQSNQSQSDVKPNEM